MVYDCIYVYGHVDAPLLHVCTGGCGMSGWSAWDCAQYVDFAERHYDLTVNDLKRCLDSDYSSKPASKFVRVNYYSNFLILSLAP